MTTKRDEKAFSEILTASEKDSESTLTPSSLTRSVSPPPTARKRRSRSSATTAQVEAGQQNVEDHLRFFADKLSAATRPLYFGGNRLTHADWIDLYTHNLNDKGHHFVIHQHDHPIAGTHYDLRLQCNATSSISFAIMYGLPGDPNSRRLNRNANETRVHNLWNHLIETASHQTGSMLLWDTGEYSVLPYHEPWTAMMTTDDGTASEDENCSTSSDRWTMLSEQQKLHVAFQQRKLRLRLNGSRLPKGYTISLRLTADNFRSSQPAGPKRRRRRQAPGAEAGSKRQKTRYTTESSGSECETGLKAKRNDSSLSIDPHSDPQSDNHSSTKASQIPASHSDVEDQASGSESQQQEAIRKNNAYPGAINSINSIHQRRWYLSLDRKNSGFIRTINSTESSSSSSKTVCWVPASTLPQPQQANTRKSKTTTPSGFKAFHVLGRDHERSIVTGRLAGDILADEGVVGYIPRGNWRAVTE